MCCFCCRPALRNTHLFCIFFLHSLSKIVVKISLGNEIVQHQIIRWSLVQRSLSVWEPSCPRAAVFFFAFILAKKIKRIKTSLHHGEYVLQAWKTRSSVVERQFCLFVVFFVPWRNKKNYPRTFCYFCFHVFKFFPFSNWKKISELFWLQIKKNLDLAVWK